MCADARRKVTMLQLSRLLVFLAGSSGACRYSIDEATSDETILPSQMSVTAAA